MDWLMVAMATECHSINSYAVDCTIRTQAAVAHFNNLMLGTVFSLFKEIYEDFAQTKL